MVRPGGEELRPDPPAPSLRAQEPVHPPRSPHLAPAPPEADRHGGILAEGRAVVVRHPDLRPLRAGSGVLQILPAPAPPARLGEILAEDLPVALKQGLVVVHPTPLDGEHAASQTKTAIIAKPGCSVASGRGQGPPSAPERRDQAWDFSFGLGGATIPRPCPSPSEHATSLAPFGSGSRRRAGEPGRPAADRPSPPARVRALSGPGARARTPGLPQPLGAEVGQPPAASGTGAGRRPGRARPSPGRRRR